MSRAGSSGVKGRADLASVFSGLGEFGEERNYGFFGVQDSAIPGAALVIGGWRATRGGVDPGLELFHRRWESCRGHTFMLLAVRRFCHRSRPSHRRPVVSV